MSSLDTLITSDLAALGDDSRRNVAPLDDVLRTTNMYRDDRPGAEARRDALADERRRELVMMPLTLSHVFAHRVGRAAAGAAGLACSLLLLVMMADPLLMRLGAWFVPGLDLALLCTLTAIAVLAAYVVATWAAEAWFARRMRTAIETGDDPYRDLDALARGPVELARDAVRRVDGVSIGLSLAGLGAVSLAFGYLGVIVGAVHPPAYAWSVVGLIDTDALAKNIDIVASAVIGASTIAFFLGRACRAHDSSLLVREGSLLVRALGHWATLAAAVFVGLTTAFAGIRTLLGLGMRRELPSTEVRFLLAFGTAFALVAGSAWLLLWWRRRERARIGE